MNMHVFFSNICISFSPRFIMCTGLDFHHLNTSSLLILLANQTCLIFYEQKQQPLKHFVYLCERIFSFTFLICYRTKQQHSSRSIKHHPSKLPRATVVNRPKRSSKSWLMMMRGGKVMFATLKLNCYYYSSESFVNFVCCSVLTSRVCTRYCLIA